MIEPVDRRQLLTWLGVGAVGAICGACSTSDHAARPQSSSAPSGRGGAPASTTTPTSTRPSALDADTQAVVSRFTGRVPTQWGTDVAGVDTRLQTTQPILALTFDACGGPHGSDVDQALIDLLTREQLPATLFLNERWIDAQPAATESLVANPLFEIANHGTHHKPMSVTGRSAYGIKGCTSVAEAVDEVASNHDRLTALVGRPPRYFRSGTAYYDEVGAGIVEALGESPVSFAVNGDAGATFSAVEIGRALATPPPGAIVLMHMNQPRHATARGLAAALPELRARGTRFVTLSSSGLPLVHV